MMQLYIIYHGENYATQKRSKLWAASQTDAWYRAAYRWGKSQVMSIELAY